MSAADLLTAYEAATAKRTVQFKEAVVREKRRHAQEDYDNTPNGKQERAKADAARASVRLQRFSFAQTLPGIFPETVSVSGISGTLLY